MNNNCYYPFKPLKNAFPENSFEPEISEYTVDFHYNRYLDALEKLNKTVAKKPLWQNIPIEELSKENSLAGNVLAHEYYFSSLKPDKTSLSEYMQSRINNDFGSLDKLYEKMECDAENICGSGWIWIVENNNGQLEEFSSTNNDIPDNSKYKPIIALDLWEHAYYLDCQNDEEAYIKALEKLINWDMAEKRLKE